MKLWAIDWENDELREVDDESETHLHVTGESMEDVIDTIREEFDTSAILDIRNIRYVGTVESKYFLKDKDIKE